MAIKLAIYYATDDGSPVTPPQRITVHLESAISSIDDKNGVNYDRDGMIEGGACYWAALTVLFSSTEAATTFKGDVSQFEEKFVKVSPPFCITQYCCIKVLLVQRFSSVTAAKLQVINSSSDIATACPLSPPDENPSSNNDPDSEGSLLPGNTITWVVALAAGIVIVFGLYKYFRQRRRGVEISSGGPARPPPGNFPTPASSGGVELVELVDDDSDIGSGAIGGTAPQAYDSDDVFDLGGGDGPRAESNPPNTTQAIGEDEDLFGDWGSWDWNSPTTETRDPNPSQPSSIRIEASKFASKIKK